MGTMTTIIAVLVFFILACALCYHFYLKGKEVGAEEHAKFFDDELQEIIDKKKEEARTDMVPQSVVEKMLAEAKAHHQLALDRVCQETKADMVEWKTTHEKKIRADAIKRHKNVTKGKVSEHLVPFDDSFEYDPSDCRFLGSPIDIVVFDGLSKGEVKEVVFLEVKTGPSASLSTRERKVRDAIKDKKVSWRLIRKK